MRFPSVCYRAVTSITIAMVLLMTASLVHAQSPCLSCPSGSNLDTINVDICIGIDTFNLDVVYCHREYQPPSMNALCPGNPPRAINSVTVIQRICAAGTPLPAQDDVTWQKVLCRFSPLGGDILGLKPSIGVRPAGLYCWTVTYPRCIERSGNCLIPCWDISTDPPTPPPCCVLGWDFYKIEGTGVYSGIIRSDCSAGGQCATSCTDLGCSFDPVECEDCP